MLTSNSSLQLLFNLPLFRRLVERSTPDPGRSPILYIIKEIFRQLADTKARDAVELIMYIERLKKRLRRRR